jgi:hypothetical protein
VKGHWLNLGKAGTLWVVVGSRMKLSFHLGNSRSGAADPLQEATCTLDGLACWIKRSGDFKKAQSSYRDYVSVMTDIG